LTSNVNKPTINTNKNKYTFVIDSIIDNIEKFDILAVPTTIACVDPVDINSCFKTHFKKQHTIFSNNKK
jgi:hypothetical protein